MKIIYYLATSLLHYLLLPYLYFRIIRKKESPIRFREKLGITNAQRHDGYLIWFHCASIGELKSIIPIIDHYVKKKKILVFENGQIIEEGKHEFLVNNSSTYKKLYEKQIIN